MDKSMNCITMIAKIHFISSCFHIERVIIEFFFRFSASFSFAFVSLFALLMSLLAAFPHFNTMSSAFYLLR